MAQGCRDGQVKSLTELDGRLTIRKQTREASTSFNTSHQVRFFRALLSTMSVQTIHRSVYDFNTASSMERALALDKCDLGEEDIPLVANWKLDSYDETTTVDCVNDSYAEVKRLKVLASYNVFYPCR